MCGVASRCDVAVGVSILMCPCGRAWLTPSLAVQLQIEEVSRKLRSGDLGIPANIEERFVPPPPGASPTIH